MSRDAASFDRLYREAGDPWNYETSAYEAEKYARCLALLPPRRFPRALEVGCSIGVMSETLARHCDSLLGLDFAPTAIDRAKTRGIPNARFEVAAVPQDWPEGQWDLIVLSEVLYYLSATGLEDVLRLIVDSLAPDGVCLVAGYLGPTETTLTARDVEALLLAALSADRPKHDIRRDAAPTWIAAAFVCGGAQSSGG
ncbi:class I SAM-dependent methyltransferase [Pseudooceanicola sp. HF7]|uniref:class I SAM-dependent DNA methyltransferase n=1 Tax=Pseudooceanicola sp. HF7 TaxID=2721560 RepID=UPI0014313B1F|nr:SAM-dependent methyltransferase [Pseudooceanicola sp. HF7]NIZ11266.1 methyltransferase domain-containing protein [Pseudooceanicola sp. HF7]